MRLRAFVVECVRDDFVIKLEKGWSCSRNDCKETVLLYLIKETDTYIYIYIEREREREREKEREKLIQMRTQQFVRCHPDSSVVAEFSSTNTAGSLKQLS